MFNCTDPIGHLGTIVHTECVLCGEMVFLVTVIVTTLLVNVLVLIMINSFQYSKSPDVQVFSLAVLNVGNVLGPVLTSVIVSLSRSGGNGINIAVACQFWYWFFTFQTLSTGFVIVFLSFECLRVVFSPSASSEPNVICSIKSIVFLVVVSVLLSSCPFMGWGKVSLHHGMCFVKMSTGFGICLIIIWYTQLIITALSLLLFTLMYKRHLKIQTLSRSTNPYTDRRASEPGPSSSGTGSWMNDRTRASRLAEYNLLLQDARKLFKFVGTITAFHFALWLPLLVTLTRELITDIHHDEWLCWSWQFSLIGGILNPVIYSIAYKTYRRGMRAILSNILHCTPGRISIPRSMRKNRVCPQTEDANTLSPAKEL